MDNSIFFDFPIVDSKYILTDYLAYGGSSKVFSAESAEGPVVLKVIRKDKQFSQSHEHNLIQREAEIMNTIKVNSGDHPHPNILKLVDGNLSGTQSHLGQNTQISYLALENCEKGTVYQILKEKQLNMEVIRLYLLQLTSALKYMHDLNIAHLDIKPSNILLDANDNIKLADFGWAVQTASKFEFIDQKMGTKYFMAPEITRKEYSSGYNPFAADIYSLGANFYFFLTGKIPKKQNSDTGDEMSTNEDGSPQKRDTQIFDILRECLSMHYEEEITLITDLVQQMMHPEPSKRPSTEQILAHEWFEYGFSLKLIE
jgi:serine/threonine protein kinase